MTPMRTVTILVCGDPMRGDDGIAAEILRRLPATTLHLADVRHVGGLMPDDLLSAPEPIIVVDAVAGAAPGEVIDLPLGRLRAGRGDALAPHSTHGLPMPAVLAIAERIRGELPEGRFIGIAGDEFGIGTAISDATLAAVPQAAARLGHWVRVLAHGQRVPICA
jgi:hydrogenase maturation protease